MITIEQASILKGAIGYYGYNTQMIVAIEEMSELTKTLTKKLRPDATITKKEIVEELADVEIMLEEVKMMFDFVDDDDIDKAIDFKINRLKERMNHEKSF